MALRSVASLSPDDPEPPTDRHDPDLGRRIVLGLVIAILILSVTLPLWLQGRYRPIRRAGQLVLEFTLGVELYRGRTWARWLAVGLLGVAVVGSSWFLATRSFEPLQLGALVVHGSSALLLVFQPAVRAHFEEHRSC